MINNGKIVNLAYSLKNDQGLTLDQADAKSPFVYLHGASQIVPGLEQALAGLKKGDKKKISVPATGGYGEVDPDLKIEVPRDRFPKDVELKPGMSFETSTPDGHGLVFTVESINGDKVKIDGNHPLAGQTLHFEVEVLDVREPTPEELAQLQSHSCCGGHEHGEGCCDGDGDEEGGCCGGHGHKHGGGCCGGEHDN